MKKIDWCLQSKGGLEFTEPNESLCSGYLKKAENALKVVSNEKDNPEWQISAAYYAMYFSAYAILIRIGFKSAMHSCTIEFLREFLGEYFSLEEIKSFEQAQALRERVQYYVVANKEIERIDVFLNNASRFNTKCIELTQMIDYEFINKIHAAVRDNNIL